MINKVIEFSVNNRMFVFMATLLLIIFGAKSFQELSIDAVPDITNTQVQINTQVKGLVPEEVERMVTFPIEYSMNGIPGVETIRSISRYGISQVTVIFEEDMDVAWQEYEATEASFWPEVDLQLQGRQNDDLGGVEFIYNGSVALPVVMDVLLVSSGFVSCEGNCVPIGTCFDVGHTLAMNEPCSALSIDQTVGAPSVLTIVPGRTGKLRTH